MVLLSTQITDLFPYVSRGTRTTACGLSTASPSEISFRPSPTPDLTLESRLDDAEASNIRAADSEASHRNGEP